MFLPHINICEVSDMRMRLPHMHLEEKAGLYLAIPQCLYQPLFQKQVFIFN